MAWQRKHGRGNDAWFVGSTTVLRTHIQRYVPHALQVFQGLAHSKLIGSLTRITRRTQGAVQRLGSLRIPARRRRTLVEGKGLHDLWCISNGCWLTCWVGCFSSTAQDAVPWSKEGLFDHIMGFIVTYDMVGYAARLPYLAE